MFDVFTCAMFANLSANICNEIWERNCIIGVWLPFEEIYGTNLHNLCGERRRIQIESISFGEEYFQIQRGECEIVGYSFSSKLIIKRAIDIFFLHERFIPESQLKSMRKIGISCIQHIGFIPCDSNLNFRDQFTSFPRSCGFLR